MRIFLVLSLVVVAFACRIRMSESDAKAVDTESGKTEYWNCLSTKYSSHTGNEKSFEYLEVGVNHSSHRIKIWLGGNVYEGVAVSYTGDGYGRVYSLGFSYPKGWKNIDASFNFIFASKNKMTLEGTFKNPEMGSNTYNCSATTSEGVKQHANMYQDISFQ